MQLRYLCSRDGGGAGEGPEGGITKGDRKVGFEFVSSSRRG